MEKTDIVSLTYEELTAAMEDRGEAPYRAGQIYQWLHQKLVTDFDQMTNLSLALREQLSDAYEIPQLQVLMRQDSKQDATSKFLFGLADGNQIESVYMAYPYGHSVCISSQAGCRMGCTFCASAIGGWKRDLTTSEMLLQVYQIQRIMGKRISNVVVMGTGEPLDNYDHLLAFLRMISDPKGVQISQRSITVSTCGIVPKIDALSKEHLSITLALSLHSALQEKREALMPIAKTYALPEVMAACDAYFQETGRRVTYEYALAAGVNDTPEDVQALGALLAGRNCHVNLIPINPVRERNFVRPGDKKALEFKNKLEKYGINVTIRKERGADIDGACGQLRRRYQA